MRHNRLSKKPSAILNSTHGMRPPIRSHHHTKRPLMSGPRNASIPRQDPQPVPSSGSSPLRDGSLIPRPDPATNSNISVDRDSTILIPSRTAGEEVLGLDIHDTIQGLIWDLLFLRSLCMPYDQISSFEPLQPHYEQIPSFNPQAVPVQPTQLTGDNFHSYVLSGRDCLVEFYADWCSACRLFEPQFKQLASQLAPRDIQCGRVNIDSERDLASQYGVVRVPSLMLVRNESIYHYTDINNIAGGPVLSWIEDIVTRPLPPAFVTRKPSVKTTARTTTATTTSTTKTVETTTEFRESRCQRICTREYK